MFIWVWELICQLKMKSYPLLLYHNCIGANFQKSSPAISLVISAANIEFHKYVPLSLFFSFFLMHLLVLFCFLKNTFAQPGKIISQYFPDNFYLFNLIIIINTSSPFTKSKYKFCKCL